MKRDAKRERMREKEARAENGYDDTTAAATIESNDKARDRGT